MVNIRKYIFHLALLAVLLSCGRDDVFHPGRSAKDETGEEPVCVLNAGWPCTCDITEVETCDDGSTCIWQRTIGDATIGFCSPECSYGFPSSCPAVTYGYGWDCSLLDPESNLFYCVVYCSIDEECPWDQTCQYVPGDYDGANVSICYPPPAGSDTGYTGGR